MTRKKIPPSEKIRKEINKIYEGLVSENLEGKDLFKNFKHLAMLLMAQEILEREVEEFLERKYYQRDKEKSSQNGYRNGYEPKQVKTSEEKLILQIPQVRNNSEEFNSRFKQFLRNNTDVLEKLVVEMYRRGLSTRDIEEVLYQATGERILSKSSVSKLTEILWEDYKRFTQRDLSKYEIVYLNIDAVYEAMTVRPSSSSLRKGLKERYNRQ